MLNSNSCREWFFRYKGFLLLKEGNESWLVRPERSPMEFLPFRANSCSLTQVKELIDNRLEENLKNQAA